MDTWLTVTKPPTGRVPSTEKINRRASHKYKPYGVSNPNGSKVDEWSDKIRTEKILAPLVQDGAQPSSSALTKHLLSTLADESNPITHSDIAQRSDSISLMTGGHERSERRGRRPEYLEERKIKLDKQTSERGQDSRVLDGTKVYINGYLNGTTDIEMKRILSLGGATVLNYAAGATHILTSQQLNGGKTHKILTKSARIKVHVIKPEWVTDSINAGKRLSERNYSVIKNTTTGTLVEAFSRSAG